MDFFLKCENQEIQLPVLPSGYEITAKFNHSSVEIVSLGEISIKGTRGLEGFSISSFFPGAATHGGYQTRGVWKSPLVLTNKIKSWAAEKKVVRVIITETNVNKEFLITDFSFGESGAAGDVDFSLTFTEYRIPKVVEKGTKSTLKKRGGKPTVPKTYTVKKRDSLKSIAKKFFGSSSKFKTIAELNHIPAPYTVKEGTVIVLQ